MITAEQWVQRQAQLDAARIERRQTRSQISVWPTPDEAPFEIAPGRGDLSYTSSNVPVIPTALQLVGPYTVSFARIFMSQPWVAAAVMRLMTWASRVPLYVYKRDATDPNNNKRLGSEDHPLAAAIEHPWKGASQLDLVHAMLGPVLVHGHSVIEIGTDKFNNVKLTPHDWRFCRPIMPRRNQIDGFRFDFDQDYYHDTAIENVLFTRWWSPLYPVGCSPLQQLGVTLQIEDAAQRHQRSNLQNANRTSGMVTMDKDYLGYDIKERQQVMSWLRDDITAIYAGPENAGRPMLLPPGLSWLPTAMTNVEAALVDQRKITREEVAAVFQIPPPLMGILDRATYSNIQTQRDMVYTDVVGPYLVLLEQTINAQLVRDQLQDDDVYVAFDFAAVLRGDRLQEINSIREAIGMGLLTPNEGRGILGDRKLIIPGMDSTYLPLVNNLVALGAENGTLPTGPSGPTGQPDNSPLDPDETPDEAPPDLPGQPQRGHNGHRQVGAQEFHELVVASGYRQRER